MEKEKLQEILKLHKGWLLNSIDGCRANLSRANLRGADLSRADLRDANLRGANLSRANLRDADLRGADLSRANLSCANLSCANLSYADLRGADLNYADLRGVNLNYADLRDADLDYSCLPLWCGSLRAGMDDKQVIQLLYHVLSIVKNSPYVSESVKELLLTDDLLSLANKFHRVGECGELTKEVK